MTIIYAATEDQHLIATVLPKLAQNNVNTVRLHVVFDKPWDAYPAKSAVFTTSKSARPYPVPLSAGGDCLIPAEVLAEECKLYIVVEGKNTATGTTKASTRLTVKVLGGHPAVIISDPAPSVYSRLLNENAVLASRLSAIEAGETADADEVVGIRTGADGTKYATAGDAVRGQFGLLDDEIDALRLVEPTMTELGTFTAGEDGPSTTRARLTNRIKSYRTSVSFAKNSTYQYGYAVYNEAGTFDGVDHGWNSMTNGGTLIFEDCYFRLNFKRIDEADLTAEDLAAITACVTIKHLHVLNDVEELKRAVYEGEGVPLPFALEVGSITEGVETPHAHRLRFADSVAVTAKTTALFGKSSEYMYGYAVYDENGKWDGVDHGWNLLNTDQKVQFERGGFVRINFRRVDDAAVTDADRIACESLLALVEPTNVGDVVKKLDAEATRKDALASVNIEHGRYNGASYVFVRIPKTTNDGRALRPRVRLTSADGSLDGAKTSALAYARKNSTVFVLNAGLFDTGLLQPVGQTIIEGEAIVSAPMTDDMGAPISASECYPLCIDANGDLSAPYARSVTTAQMIADGVVYAVTGWGKVVENFAACSDTVTNEIVHSGKYIRQVIGQFQNGDYFVCTVDMSRGTVENEAGITYASLAQLLINKGVKFAYSLDGGGSAETVIGSRQINPIYEGETGRAVPTVIIFEA